MVTGMWRKNEVLCEYLLLKSLNLMHMFLECYVYLIKSFFTAPTAPPGNLKVFNRSSTSLNATWSAPPIDKTHGFIRYYLIKYWEVQCSDFFYDSHNLTVRTKTVASTLRSVIVDELDYWKCYQVNISAVTVGEGPYATDIETRTTENGEL